MTGDADRPEESHLYLMHIDNMSLFAWIVARECLPMVDPSP